MFDSNIYLPSRYWIEKKGASEKRSITEYLFYLRLHLTKGNNKQFALLIDYQESSLCQIISNKRKLPLKISEQIAERLKFSHVERNILLNLQLYTYSKTTNHVDIEGKIDSLIQVEQSYTTENIQPKDNSNPEIRSTDEQILSNKEALLLPNDKKNVLIIRIIILIFIIILIASILMFHLFSKPKAVFPDFGIGTIKENAVNYDIMEHEFLREEKISFDRIQSSLKIDAILNKGGFAVTSFEKKLPIFGDFFDLSARLNGKLFFKVEITTAQPNFEIGFWDTKTRVFFDCQAPRIGEISDFIIDLDEAYLTKNGSTFQPQFTKGLSIGFTNDAGSKSGRHSMKVYGITNIPPKAAPLNPCLCSLRIVK